MLDSGENPKISEVQKEKDDERLLALTDDFEKEGQETTIEEVKNDILNNPDWLLDSNIFDEDQVESNNNLLSALRENKISELDNLYDFSRTESVNIAFVLRFLEVFSETYDFPYVWRGGSLEDVDKSIKGTFTFFVKEAKSFVMKSYTGT